MRWAWLLLLMMPVLGCGDAEVIAPPAPLGAEGEGEGEGEGEAEDEDEDEGEGEEATPFPDPDWPTASPEAHGLDAAQIDIAAEVAEGFDSYCLLVIRHGHLVYERYFQGHDESTPQTSWSIAKSHSATLVGIALERGDFGSLDDSVAQYVPQWLGTPREAITLRDVLSMTTGLSWSAFDDYFVLAVLSQNNTDHAIGLSLDVDPGESWVYHNGGVQILEPVFRAATGMSIEAYAEAHLWSRIGITASWHHDPAGNPTAYASVLASCRDQARMGYLFHHDGNWAGEQVVPAAFVAEAITPSQHHNRAYGYLWWLNAETPAISAMGKLKEGRLSPVAPPDMFAMRGFGNQFVDVIPSLDMIVVRFGSDPMSSFDVGKLIDDARFDVHEEILAPILAAVEAP